MKKYIDAERLRAEINKRKKSLRAGICGEAFTRKQKNEMLVASEELDRFNRIIDSLQQEQPSLPDDLDEAAEKWCKENNKGIALCADKKSHYLADGMDAFKAGAKWAIQQLKVK